LKENENCPGRCILGKKIVLIILVFFLSIPGFSLELNIVNKYDNTGLNGSFSNLFYFRERLFCFSTRNILYATENTFEYVIEKKITDEIFGKEYYQVAQLCVSDDNRRLFYYIFGMDDTRDYTGFEITVDNNGGISYRERNKDEIDANTVNKKPPYFVEPRSNELYGYWLKKQEREEGLNNPPHIDIVDRKNNKLYNLSGLFEHDYIIHYAINEKMNRLAIFLNDKKDYGSFRGENSYVVELSVVYDAVINDARVQFGSEAGLGGGLRWHLNRNGKLKVIDRSDEKQKIDPYEFEYYWYLVRTETGQEGWIHGAYIHIEGE
jgi:hypothetical protein